MLKNVIAFFSINPYHLTTHLLKYKYTNDQKFKKVESFKDHANLFLHKLYRWETYYLSDMNGSLVKKFIATAKRPI